MMKCKTLKNKISAVVLLAAGLVPAALYQDATFLVFTACIGIPLFFAKENWMY